MNRAQQSPLTPALPRGAHCTWPGGSDNRHVRRRSAIPSKMCARTPGRQEEHSGAKLRVPRGSLSHGRFHSSQHWKTGSYQSWLPDGTAVLTGSSGKAWTLRVKPRRTHADQCITHANANILLFLTKYWVGKKRQDIHFPQIDV